MTIIQHANTVVDLSRVKGMQVIKDESAYDLTIELNNRLEYVFNPSTNDWEKQEFEDKVKIRFDDYEMAVLYLAEWAELWQEYGKEKKE